MRTMAAALALLALAASCLAAGVAADWKNLHVKYALWDGFYNMPSSVSEVNGDDPPKYVKMAHDEELNADLYSYPKDPRVSIIFDSFGNIAGLRTAYVKADVARRAQSKGLTFPYSFNNKPMYSNATYWNTDVWYTSVLFISPEKLKAGGRQETNGVVAEDVYVKVDGKWTLIYKDECKVESQGFTKQACFVGMGMHYFYKVTPTSKCEDFQGVFLLYESGALIGLGFNPFGTFTTEDREWFEDVPAKVVTEIVPNGPECMTDYVTDYGATSLHIMFKKFPRLTFCTWPWQKSDRCEQ